MPLRLSRRSKYGNHKTVVDGVKFDSQAEARRWQELQMLRRTGEVVLVVPQPTFDLTVNGIKVCRYVADFYVVKQGGEVVIEDVKGVKTAAYRLKAKLFKALFGFAIQEIR